MRSLLGIVCGVSLLLASSSYATLTVNMGAYQAGIGGEFAAVGQGTEAYLGPFQTFCIETGEYLQNWGYTYDVVVNTAAVKGGTSTSDPLSKGTTWLFSQFAAGTLSLYAYANTPNSQFANRKAAAADLQNAIWALEGEGGDSGNYYATLVAGHFGNSFANAQVDAAGAEFLGVVALNLYQKGHREDLNYLCQDVLAVVPEPTTMIAGALLLLPFCASTIRILRRKA